MAQVCGKSIKDFIWSQKLEVVLTHIRQASDAYAADKVKEIPLATMVGSMLYPLTMRPRQIAPIRDLRSIQLTATMVLEMLRPTAPKALIKSTAESLETVLRTASAKWNATGYPEDPATLEILNRFVEILYRAQFTKHPPNEGDFRAPSQSR